MITTADLKIACNGLLKIHYPEMEIYGVATAEQFEKPCFFTEIVPHGLEYESKNWARNAASYKITFMQQEPDEAEQLQKLEEIRQLFGLKLAVADRKINVTRYEHEYVGQYRDLLQITVYFSWYENMRKSESDELMQHVEITPVTKGE